MTETPESKLEPLTQNERFRLSVMTRLARLHHLLEDIQEVILQIPCLQGGSKTEPLRNIKPSPSAPPLSIERPTKP